MFISGFTWFAWWHKPSENKVLFRVHNVSGFLDLSYHGGTMMAFVVSPVRSVDGMNACLRYASLL